MVRDVERHDEVSVGDEKVAVIILKGREAGREGEQSTECLEKGNISVRPGMRWRCYPDYHRPLLMTGNLSRLAPVYIEEQLRSSFSTDLPPYIYHTIKLVASY